MTEFVSWAAQVAVVTFPLMMIVAGAGDVITRRIPNALCAALALMFFPLAAATGMPVWLIGSHVVTGAVLLLAGYGLFILGYIGGGDAKLLAVAGLWVGFPAMLPFLLLSALAGGLLAAGIGIWFATSSEMRLNSEVLDRALAPLAPDLPYGFALAAGAILTMPHTWWMAAAAAQT